MSNEKKLKCINCLNEFILDPNKEYDCYYTIFGTFYKCDICSSKKTTKNKDNNYYYYDDIRPSEPGIFVLFPPEDFKDEKNKKPNLDFSKVFNDIIKREKTKLVQKKLEGSKNQKPKRDLKSKDCKPKEIFKHLNKHVIAQDKAKRALSIAVSNHYKRKNYYEDFGNVTSKTILQKSNVIITGPSGTGKTELVRSIAKFLDVPFYIMDATRITAAGYIGDSADTMIRGLYDNAGGDIERAQWGIVFIDEIDKLARETGGMKSPMRDIGGEGAQQSLLKIIEGTTVVIPGTEEEIDTSNILFIAGGSFAGINDVVLSRINAKAKLGFGSEQRAKIDNVDIYSSIHEDDLLAFGMIPELLGRFPVITSTFNLSVDDIARILVEPENSIIDQFKLLFKIDGTDLQFEDGALKAIAEMAANSSTGVRALRRIVESVLEPVMFEYSGDTSIRKIVITEGFVKGNEEVKITKKSGKPRGRPRKSKVTEVTDQVTN